MREKAFKEYRIIGTFTPCKELPKCSSKTLRIYSYGMKIKVFETKEVKKDTWGRCEYGWVCLQYCRPE